MKYVHVFTFQTNNNTVTYSVKSNHQIISIQRFNELVSNSNIDEKSSPLINHTVFLNEENN